MSSVWRTYSFLSIILFSFFLCAHTTFASTSISGEISADTTWSLAGSPYIIESNIYIYPEATLTIDSGVVVKFTTDTRKSFSVDGNIRALGTSESPIYFTSIYDDTVGGDTDGEGEEFCYDNYDAEDNYLGEICEIIDFEPFASDWGEIYFDHSIGNIFENTFFRYSKTGLTFYNSRAEFRDVSFSETEDALTIYNDSHITFSGLEVRDIYDDPITIFNDSSFSGTGLTLNNVFASRTDAVVVFNNSDLSLKDSVFVDCPNEACITFFDGRDIFYQTNPSSVTVEDSIFDGGLGSAFLTFGTTNITTNIQGSVIQGFEYYGIENYSAFPVFAEGNFWGDASGPFHQTLNTTGLGELMRGNMDFDPWLSSDPFDVPVCCSSVLFFPGFEGSRLYKEKSVLGIGVEDQLWEPNANSDVVDLFLNADGTSINRDIYTKDIIKEVNIPTSGSYGLNIYKSFARKMDGMVSDNVMTNWHPFAYDWRKSTEEIVNTPQKYDDGQEILLTSVLQSLVSSSKNGKVTIIGHSNGGILAKTLLKKLEEDKSAGRNNLIDSIDVLILVASPEIGTASAVPAILHGYNQAKLGGFLMSELNARELGRNMKGAYGLLPSREYINHVSSAPIEFEDFAIPSGATTPFIDAYGEVVDSYDEYKNFLLGAEGRRAPSREELNLPIKLSPDLFAEAESLHDSIDAWIPPASLRVIELAGWGIDTVAGFKYVPINHCDNSSLSSCHFILDQRPEFTADGDSTVIVPSAHHMSFQGNAEKYFVNLDKYNDDNIAIINKSHPYILEVDPILDFISNILQKIPLADSPYISTTVPAYTGDRVRVSIHSPVSIDAYDNAGNHTGKVCPETSEFCYAEEAIPNSSYLEFGEGKYINLPEEHLQNIKLVGTGVGTFTYHSTIVAPEGTENTSSFVDIPVTTETQGEVVLGAGEVPELKLDVNGDGIYEFTIVPSETFDPVMYLEIMKATINSLDLTKAQKKAFTARVDNIIKAIKKGKISKAKLRAEKFQSALEKKISKSEKKNDRHHKPKKISKEDAQILLDMLNKLLDNIN